jgi:leader peptidase (prepilin peptidase)/N-methyltransferase
MFIEQFAQFPSLWAMILIVIGLLVGSFLNVVILRMPQTMEHEWKSQCRDLLEIESPTTDDEAPPNIVFPPSHCPQCKANLTWWQNIPVLSYLILRGKCHACHKSISLRYPAIEIMTALLTLLAGMSFPQTATLPWILILIWLLIAMSVIDFDTQLLPDNLTLPLLWLGLLYSTVSSPVSPTDSIIGAAAGYMVLWTIYQIHFLITKRQGMGYGDFKLLAAAGAWLGWQQLPLVLLISAAAGLAITLSLILFRNHHKDQAVPFGPYLAIAFVITLFWGQPLIQQYLNMAGFST